MDSAIMFILRSEKHNEKIFKKLNRFLEKDLVFNVGI